MWKINLFGTLDQTRWIPEGLFYLQSYQVKLLSHSSVLNVLSTKTLPDTSSTKKGKGLLTLAQPQEKTKWT